MSCRHYILGIFCLGLLWETSLFAEVVTIEGAVKSVDAMKRTISVETEGKTKDFDVSSKAKIHVDGKDASLDSLKAGQRVTLSYHDELDVVLKIDTGSEVTSGEESLLAGDSREGWQAPKRGEDISNWTVKNGVLTAQSNGASIRTAQTYGDFDLHLEFKLPPKCNSGVYLRGRYEVQLLDSQWRRQDGKAAPPTQKCGAIYNQIAPSKDVYKGPNQWNTLDVRLVGDVVTVRMNDSTIIDAQTLRGVTPSPLDENESDPGPILLQAHVVVGQEFRNVRIKPISDAGEKSAATTNGGNDEAALFNGSDLTGWTVLTHKGTKDPSKNTWIVDADRKVLASLGEDWNDLRTEGKYKNFTLNLEWRFTPGRFVSPNGSGIIIRSNGLNTIGLDPRGIEIDLRQEPTEQKDQDSQPGHFIAYSMPIKNYAGETDGEIGKSKPGRHLKVVKKAGLRPPGQWNTTTISCQGDRIKVNMNGVLVNEGWGVPEEAGHICLRNQNSSIEFRNITLSPAK